jgi:predicted porin
MKKSLIALAVAGAVSAPAMAATSNVDIYGNIGLSYDYVDTGSNVPGQDKKLSRVSSNSSRIGFKGSEDLGSGLAAIWQIEEQIEMDNGNNNLGVSLSNPIAGTGTLGNNTGLNLRNTFLGLSSKSMGTVLMGKHDTPYKLATAKLDIFADTSADYNNIIGNFDGSNVFDLRPGNVLAYITPMFNGIHGAIAYVFGNELGTTGGANADAWSAMGMYDNGPIFASLAYEKHNNLNGLSAFDNHSWKLGAGYNFGDGQVGFIYEDSKVMTQSRKAYYLNGQYNMGNIALKAAYGHAGKISSTTDTAANTYSLGVDYNLSKRSKLYAQYTKTNNQNNAEYGVGAGGVGYYIPNNTATAGAGFPGVTSGAVGNDPSVFSIGMRHTF